MTTITIRSNGLYSGDSVEVLDHDNNILLLCDWNEMDPRKLEELLKDLGHTVIHVTDYKFDHDED